jgi:hypothetical protein
MRKKEIVMKIIKIMVLMLMCAFGFSSGLQANSSSTDTATNLANSQATYLSQLASMLNATTWASYLTISGQNARDVLYNAIDVADILPNPSTVWDAIYKSLQHGATLAFLATDGSNYTLSDITMLQSRLTEATNKHVDSRSSTIQYALYLVFLKISLTAVNLNDFLTDIQYGVPTGSPSGTTIFDLTMNNLPGYGPIIENIQNNPQDIFARALIHGIDLISIPSNTGFTDTVTKLSQLQNLFTTAQSKYNTMFNNYPGTQEKIYCKFLYIASTSTTGIISIDTFWSILSNVVPAGKNVFDIVLNASYTPVNQSNLVSVLIAAFNNGIVLASAATDLNRFQSYLNQAKTKYSGIDFSSVQQALDIKKAPYTETPLIAQLQAVTTATIFKDITDILNNALALTTVTTANSTNLVTLFSQAFKIAITKATQDQLKTLSSLLTNVPAWLSSSTNSLMQSISELPLIANLTTAATATKLSDITPFLTNAIQITSPLTENVSNLTAAFAMAFTNALTLTTNTTDINTLVACLPPAQGSYLSTAYTPINRHLKDVQLVINLTNAASATKLGDITPFLTQAVQMTFPLDNMPTLFTNAFSRAISLATSKTDIDLLKTYLPPTQGNYLSTLFTPLNNALSDKQNSFSETNLITQLNAVTTATIFKDITDILNNALALTTVTTANSTNLVNAFSQAFKIAISIATLAQCDTLNSMLANTIPTWLSPSVASLQQAITARKTALQEADTETQLIANLPTAASATKLGDITKYLTQAIAITTPLAANVSNLTTLFTNAFNHAVGITVSNDDITTLASCLPPAQGSYLSALYTQLNNALTDRKNALPEDDVIKKLNSAKAAPQFDEIITLIKPALGLTTVTAANKDTIINLFVNAINIAITKATLDQLNTLNSLLATVPSWLSTSVDSLKQSISAQQADLTLIINLTNAFSAPKLSDITPYLTQAAPLTYPIDNLTTAFTNAFNRAISLASSATDISTLTNCLPPAQGGYLSGLRTNLANALATKQQQLQDASDAAAKAAQETKLIADLKAATIFAALLPLLTTALAPTYTPINATDLTSTVATAFNTAVTAAASLAELTQLSNLLKTPPTYISSNVQSFNTAITTRQQQLQDASNAAAKAAQETKLIADLKAATTSAALLPLLTTALAPTYTPINATDLTSTVATAFNTAVTAAASLADLTSLSNLLKTPPTYISSNIQSFNTAITARQQQLQPANNATTETTIITALKASRTSLDALFSNLDIVIAATYQPINLTNLKAAVFAGITRSITLITTSNYITVQTKIATYISNATPKYLTTAQKTSLTTSLATKIKSIRTSLISPFTSKITSFTSVVTTAIATRTTPAAVLAQRQEKLTKAIQAAATIIDTHTQLAPSTTELAQTTLRSAYTSFNTSIIKLIQDQGFIKKTGSGQNTTYTLAYNATVAEPKTSLKKVLTFMSSTNFPQLSSAQKNIITAINASIA